jgi:hypothetical protein
LRLYVSPSLSDISGRANDHFATAMQNLRNMMKYERLDASGPGKGAIDVDHPLVDPYFTVLDKAIVYPMDSFKQVGATVYQRFAFH